MKSYSPWYLSHNSRDGIRIFCYPLINGERQKPKYLPKAKINGKSQDELEQMLRQLNATYEQRRLKAEARYDFDHAFINAKTLGAFEKHLLYKNDNERYIKDMMMYLNTHALLFFIKKKKLANPVDWRSHQYEFGERLLKKMSLSSVRKVNQVTNQFLKFLSDEYPDAFSQVHLDFVSKSKADSIVAKKKLEDGEDLGKYIDERTVNLLLRYSGKLKPHILLGLNFGLRAGEVLGLTTDDVYQEALDIKRQIKSHTDGEADYKPVKGKTERTVFYWFTTPDEAYRLIEARELMHRDTLSHAFVKLVQHVNKQEKLDLDFTFHDLRSTFITNAVRKYDLRDVQLAAGHKDMRTTMGYIQDDRTRTRTKFKPQSQAKETAPEKRAT